MANLLMITTGRPTVITGNENNSKTGYRSSFDHKNEFASPGYYSVLLEDYNVKAELTATARSGFYRCTFQKSDRSNIIIDIKNRDHVLEYHLEA